MRNRRGDRQQQTGRGGQGRGQTASGHQGDHPVGQAGDFRVGQHHNVVIDLDHFIAACVRRVLDQAVAVLVLELEQTGGLPVFEPLRAVLISQVLAGLGLDNLHEVQTRHARNGRRRGVEDGDKHQRPAGGRARILHFGHGKETDDDVRQARRADH